MITLRNFGAKITTLAIATGLAAGAALAAMNGCTIDVTLAQPVNVGNTTLPSGQYKISQVPLATAESIFVFRNDKGDTAAVVTGNRTADPRDVNASGGSAKTDLILKSNEDGTLHLHQMFIQGDEAGFDFMQ